MQGLPVDHTGHANAASSGSTSRRANGPTARSGGGGGGGGGTYGRGGNSSSSRTASRQSHPQQTYTSGRTSVPAPRSEATMSDAAHGMSTPHLSHQVNVSQNGYAPAAQTQAGHSALDILIGALAASGGGGGMQGMGMAAQSAPSGPPPAPMMQQNLDPTAMSLDQIFGHNGFSSAMSTAQSVPSTTSLPTTFQVAVLNRLLAAQDQSQVLQPPLQPPAQSHQSDPMAYSQNQAAQQAYTAQSADPSSATANAPPTPYQQTRSGRISRPPPQPIPFGIPTQHQQQQGASQFPMQTLLRAVQTLQQPGMEAVRQALATTEWINLLSGPGSQAHSTGGMDYPGPVQEYPITPTADQEGMEGAAYGSESTPPAEVSGRKRRKRNPSPSNVVDGRSGMGMGRDRGVSTGSSNFVPMDAEIDERASASKRYGNGNGNGNGHGEVQKTAWPLPPRGKGSRLAMTREEIIERRKERNKASAQASRARRMEKTEELREGLRVKEEEMKAVEERCASLEQEVGALRMYILASGLTLPDLATLESRYAPPPTQSKAPAQGTSQGRLATLGPEGGVGGSEVNGNATTANNPLPQSTVPIDPTLELSAPTSTSQTPNLGTGAGSNTNTSTIPPGTDTGANTITNTDTASTSNPFSFPYPYNYTYNPIGLGTFDTGAEPLLDFNLFMNLDGLDDDDDDFQPETSPQHASGSESDTDGEGEEDENGTPRNSVLGSASAAGSARKSRKGRKGRSKGKSKSKRSGRDDDRDTELDPDATPRGGEDEDDFIDPEMEDEDLFLPIEDVPIPPEAVQAFSQAQAQALGTGQGQGQGPVPVSGMRGGDGGKEAGQEELGPLQLGQQTLNDITQDMMLALKVDTRDQLAAVMRKLVESAGEGVGEDVRDKLRNVMYLAQSQTQGSALSQGDGQGQGQGQAETQGQARTQAQASIGGSGGAT